MQYITGKTRRAHKGALYGPEGVGKTTLMAALEAPLFIDMDKGADGFEHPRRQPNTWAEMIADLTWVYQNSNDFKNIIVDTVSVAETLAVEHICATHKMSSIEDFGYGKGWVMLGEQWAELMRIAQSFIGRDINFWMVGHADVTKFKDPAGTDYDRWSMRLHQKHVYPLVKRWADMLFFIDHDKTVQSVDEGFGRKRYVATSYGDRILYTAHRATHDSKNRYRLPESFQVPQGNPQQTWVEINAWIDYFFAT